MNKQNLLMGLVVVAIVIFAIFKKPMSPSYTNFVKPGASSPGQVAFPTPIPDDVRKRAEVQLARMAEVKPTQVSSEILEKAKSEMPSKLVVPKAVVESSRRLFSDRLKSYLANEKAARAGIQDMASCVSQNEAILQAAEKPVPAGMEGASGMPNQGAIAAKMKNAWAIAEASCIAVAQKLADRYPALQNEFQKDVVNKAKPAIVMQARSMKGGI